MENKKLIIIIPAYEPPVEFIEYARAVAKKADNLVVVNDGSDSRFNNIFDEIKTISNAHVIEYPENHGKGYALKQAFEYCTKNFDKNDILITADCDGQHKIEDVFKVFKVTQDHPESLVLGSRDFNKKNVPKRSKAGNTNIRRMFRFFYGIKVYDTQTGLRGFSVEMAEKFLKVKGDRFEYEMGMLIYAQKHQISILETPIETVYPEESKDHVSHFKTFSDSMRVLGVVFKNLNWYLFSSALSAIVDVILFWLLAIVVLKPQSAVNTLIATVTARAGSSIINFIFNFKYVFSGTRKRSIFKYYILWTFQLGVSYGLTFLFGNIVGWNLVIVKVVVDLILALLSYQIQCNWVFKKKQKKNKFHGKFVHLGKFALCNTSKKYRCNVVPPNEPAIYVCRHLNMHGPFTTLKWLTFDVHPMILNVFFTQKDCYNQYANYTFSERVGKKKKKFNLKAWFCSIFVPKMVNSLQAVPVCRNSNDSIKTFKVSMEYLLKGESIIIYPDIDYSSDYNTKSDIYSGFLFLADLYRKKTGKDLRFVPLFVDDENHTIEERDYITISSFREDEQTAKEYLINEINKK